MEEVNVRLWDSCLPRDGANANTYHHKNNGAIRPRNYIRDDRQISSTIGYSLVGLIPPNVVERGMGSIDIGYF